MKVSREEEIINRISVLNEIPDRSPLAQNSGKQRFLAEASSLLNTVSNQNNLRHTGWNTKQNLISRYFRKELTPMSSALISAFLAVTMLISGTGITAVAAQSSNANDLLYPMKLASEDIRYQLTTNSYEELKLAQEFLTRRTEELKTLVESGDQVPDQLLLNMQAQVLNVLQLCAKVDAETAAQAMAQLRQQMTSQEQLLTQLRTALQTELSLQVQSRLRDQTRLMDQLMSDPLMNQEQIRQELQNQVQQQIQQQLYGTQQPGEGTMTQMGPGEPNTSNGQGTNGQGYQSVTPTPTVEDSSTGSGSGHGSPSGNSGGSGSGH